MRLSNTQRQFLLQAATEYAQHIDQATDYLRTRGLSVEEAKMFHLGVVDNPLPGHEGYKGKLVIPYITPSGVVDIRFRSIHGEDPKYIGLQGLRQLCLTLRQC